MRRMTIVDMELSDEDVDDTVVSVVKAMSDMRLEAIINRNTSPGQKDEYLHLAYRLASLIEGSAPKAAVNKMDRVAKYMQKDEAFLHYDPFQRNYWSGRRPAIKKTLESLTIGVMKDDFNSLDNEHHILQAIKYLATKDLPFKEREQVYGTILPFNGGVAKASETRMERFMARIFGKSFKVLDEDPENLTLTAESDPEFIHEILREASGLGYTRLRTGMRQCDYDKINGKCAGIAVLGQRDPDNTVTERLFNGFARQRWLMPIHGSLPQKLQDKIAGVNYPGEGNKEGRESYEIGSFLASEAAHGLPGVGIMASGLLSADWPAIGLGGYLVGEAIVRFIYYASKGLIATLPFKIISYPIERALAREAKKGKVYTLEFPLRNLVQDTGNAPFVNPFQHYQELAEARLPEGAERNLVYGADNHHRFGMLFAEEIKKAAESKGERVSSQECIDRETQFYGLVHGQKIDDYSKWTSLYCGPGKRYVVSVVSSGKEPGFEPVARILSGEFADKKAYEGGLKRIAGLYDSEFAHLAAYTEGRLVADIEVSG